MNKCHFLHKISSNYEELEKKSTLVPMNRHTKVIHVYIMNLAFNPKDPGRVATPEYSIHVGIFGSWELFLFY